MISGFVIPHSIKNKPGQTLPFFIARFFRLYPAFWLSVLLAIVFSRYILHSEISLIQVFANLTMLPGLFSQPIFYSVYWTLLVELAFYVICIVLYHVNWLFCVKKIFPYLCFCWSLLWLVLSCVK